ncbi:MAG: GNAT family N-acetyltransferase [Acidobacteriota bacterium]
MHDLGDGMTLRPAADSDRGTLLAVYAGTREDELALTDWAPEQKLSFVTHQFEAQDQHYRLHYPGAQFLVVEHAGEPIGRLYRHDRPTEIRLMDISLLGSARGRGFGSRILRALLEEGQREHKRVTIHVEKMNRARSLYELLGFTVIADVGVYDLMEWRPS